MYINCISNNYSFTSKRKFKKLFKYCSYSGEPFSVHDTKTLEHIVPKSLGGTDDYSNLIVVKRSWNSKRSSIPIDEFIKMHPEVKTHIIESVNSQSGKIIEGINWTEEVKKTFNKLLGENIFKNPL